MSVEQASTVTPLLVLSGVTKRYGAFRALDGVDFDLQPGEVHVLFGENGVVALQVDHRRCAVLFGGLSVFGFAGFGLFGLGAEEGEEDDVANGFGVREEHGEAVDAYAFACGGG